MRNERTSKRVAALAAKGAKNPKALTLRQIQAVCASALTQAPNKEVKSCGRASWRSSPQSLSSVSTKELEAIVKRVVERALLVESATQELLSLYCKLNPLSKLASQWAHVITKHDGPLPAAPAVRRVGSRPRR